MIGLRKFHTVIVIGIVILSGCSTLSRPVEIPIPSKLYQSGIGQTEDLVIFLPGRGDDIDSFERAKFIDILQASNRVIDAVVVDAHMAYYLDSSLPERIFQDILQPYRQKGYRRFIIVGVSIGGYGALWVRHRYTEIISSIVLLAPYLGHQSLIEEIESSGDIHQWRLGLGSEITHDEKVWVWIDDMRNAESEGSVILAIGRKDKFSRAAELLSTTIPNTSMFSNDGHHNWKTWQSLWSDIVMSANWENLSYTN